MAAIQQQQIIATVIANSAMETQANGSYPAAADHSYSAMEAQTIVAAILQQQEKQQQQASSRS